MKSDYSEITTGQVVGFKFKTHKRFKEYYFNPSNPFEKQSVFHVETILKPGDVFVDIGAHHGYYSLVAANAIGKTGKILAFEPVTGNRKLLESNLSQLSDGQYQIYSQAVSDRPGKATFNIPWASDSAGLFKHPLAENIETVEVEVESLDHLLPDQKIDFVKIDTEGNELGVLQGMEQTVRRNPEVKLLIEFNPLCLRAAATDPVQVLSQLDSMGFDVYVVDDDLKATYKITDFKLWPDYLKDKNYRNLLCVAKGTPSVMVFAHSPKAHGAERSAADLARAMQDQGCIVTVSIPADPEAALRGICEALGLSWTEHQSHWWLDRSGDDYAKGQEVIEQEVMLYNYDFILSSTVADPRMSGVAQRSGKQHIWYIQEDARRFNYPFAFNEVSEFIVSTSNPLIFTSESLRQRLASAGLSSDRALIIKPLPLLDTTKPWKKKKSDILRLIIVGHLEENKNQLEAVRVVYQLSQSHPDTRIELTMAGSWDKHYKKKIDTYLSKHDMTDWVSFAGEIDDIPATLYNYDALVSCSLSESFGRAIVEAMAIGLPVLVAKNGGSEEYINDTQNGYLYDGGDTKALMSLILKLISLNTVELAGMSEAARQTYQKLREGYEEEVGKLVEYLQRSEPAEGVVMTALNARYLKDRTDSELRVIELERQLDETKRDLAALINDLNQLLGSKSWRMVSALRKLAHPRRK